MKDPKSFAKIFITICVSPAAAFIAIYGSINSDGSQVALGVAMMALLGTLWGPPGGGGSGGSHAA
jgi:hypothetical protein